MKIYGLIGFPLGHSFSKKYFTQKFLEEGIQDCVYESFPLENIESLGNLLSENPNLAGLNITIPHKQAVIPYLNDATNLPDGIAACNCIKIVSGKLIGYNTDVVGFEKSLLPKLLPKHKNALVLGNGGATIAVKYVLKKLNIGYKVVSRKIHDGSDLSYEDLNENLIKENQLIINCSPIGTFPKIDECPNIPYQFLTSQHYLFDLVYNPDKTLFLQKGEAKGAAIKNGYDMLLIQAEEGWRIWNDV